MNVYAWGATDVGLKRNINQDTILVDNKSNLFVVADGMGGHKGGEVASDIAVKTAKEIFKKNLKQASFKPRDTIRQVFVEASARIHHQSTKVKPDLAGMGTTMVLLFFHGDTLYIGNVGDSRAYLIYGDKMWQMTEDHSLVNEQVRAGIVKEDDVAMLSGKNVITRSVGYEKEVSVDILQRQMRKGESILMCSDGLSGLVTDQENVNFVKNKAVKIL